MYTNFLCKCSDGDVCHVDGQMKWWVNGKSKGTFYASQVVETYLRFPQLHPAADVLLCQAEAVHNKTVYVGSCAKVVSIIMWDTVA